MGCWELHSMYKHIINLPIFSSYIFAVDWLSVFLFGFASPGLRSSRIWFQLLACRCGSLCVPFACLKSVSCAYESWLVVYLILLLFLLIFACDYWLDVSALLPNNKQHQSVYRSYFFSIFFWKLQNPLDTTQTWWVCMPSDFHWILPVWTKSYFCFDWHPDWVIWNCIGIQILCFSAMQYRIDYFPPYFHGRIVKYFLICFLFSRFWSQLFWQ